MFLKESRELIVDERLDITPDVSQRVDDGLVVACAFSISEGQGQGDLVHRHSEIWPEKVTLEDQKLRVISQFLRAYLEIELACTAELDSSTHIGQLSDHEDGAVFIDRKNGTPQSVLASLASTTGQPRRMFDSSMGQNGVQFPLSRLY